MLILQIIFWFAFFVLLLVGPAIALDAWRRRRHLAGIAERPGKSRRSDSFSNQPNQCP